MCLRRVSKKPTEMPKSIRAFLLCHRFWMIFFLERFVRSVKRQSSLEPKIICPHINARISFAEEMLLCFSLFRGFSSIYNIQI